MIEIGERLKSGLRDVRGHLELLADPLAAEQPSHGIYAIRDSHGDIVPGALRYGEAGAGSRVAILGGIHMNEMAGVFALLKFHERWLSGTRPKSGTIYIATGHIERALEFIDLVITSDQISPRVWGPLRATKDHCNYNRVAFDILEKPLSSDFDRHAYQIVKHVLKPANGMVLDLHNTSEDAAPMVTLFMDKGETPEMSIKRLHDGGVARDLPIRDFIFWKPGPYNGMESIRSVVRGAPGSISILVENGGGANPDSFNNADICTQIWLRNVLGMEPEDHVIASTRIPVERHHYIETSELYHPAVKPEDYTDLPADIFDAAKGDTFILVRDWDSLNKTVGWSPEARQVLDTLDERLLHKNRLDNFEPIRQGDVIAIGLETGLKLCAPHDGVVMMVGASPAIMPAERETFANIGVLL